MAYAALVSLDTTFRDLVYSSHISHTRTAYPILELAVKAAKILRMAVEILDLKRVGLSRKKVNALDERIKEAVWKFEDLLDSHVYHKILYAHQHFQDLVDSHQIDPQARKITLVAGVDLDDIIDDIASFTKMMEEFKKEYLYELRHLSPEEEVDVVSSASPEGEEEGVKNCKMVGSSYYLWKIRSKLEMNHSLDVIALSGMAGNGKTALAKKIFDDPLDCIGIEFDSRAWVTIGRKWEPRKLRRDLLIQLGEGILKAKRCLIVLDDVWDNDLWNHFETLLPTHIPGRILVLLTSRLYHVAIDATPSVVTVELLDDGESWDLLRQRVFGEEEDECPPELEKAGKKIAEECDGLPLMIITVADLLRQAEMTEEYWESVARKKNSPLFMAAYDQLYEVLFPSYEYLPQQLKACFLYMGVFPQSCKIPTSGLLDLWIAEGFLCRYDNTVTIEECADRYLMHLIFHNVVMGCQPSLNWKVINSVRKQKSCRLQSAFWHLCKREATKGKFSLVLSTLDDVEESMINTQRRLSFQNNILFGINNVSDFVGDVCASTARSLLCTGPYQPYPVPICFNLRLLKVLDAGRIRFYEFPILVFHLVYLRFLALVCNNQLPASISKLWFLQVLTITQHMKIKHFGVTSYMPIEIWDMEKLKHLQVAGSNLPNPSGDASLESLLKLKCVGVETCTKEVLERIPNLKKLGIEVDMHPGDDDDMKAFHCLNHVHILRELTSLKCSVLNPIFTRSEIVSLPAPLPMLPSSLIKLHLHGTGYPWSYMSVIGSLPHLEVLKLRSYAFRGSEWVVKGGQFQTLSVLLIEETDLVKFKVELGGFIVLKKLILSNCYKLREIQWGPGQSSALTIEVFNCSISASVFAYEYNSTSDSDIPEEHRPNYVRCYY